MDCGDLSPLFNAKLAEPGFRGLATLLEANVRSILEKGHGSASFDSKAVTSPRSPRASPPLAFLSPRRCWVCGHPDRQNPMRSGRPPASTARMAVFRYMIPRSHSSNLRGGFFCACTFFTGTFCNQGKTKHSGESHCYESRPTSSRSAVDSPHPSCRRSAFGFSGGKRKRQR